MRHLLTAGISVLSLTAACSSEHGTPKDPPLLTVTSPARSTLQNGAGMVEVRGTVTPSDLTLSPVTSVSVNGVEASVEADGSFTAQVTVAGGATFLHTVAKDQDGGEATDTRAIHAGNLVDLDSSIQDAMTMAISDDAFAVMARTATSLINTTDLGPLVAAGNPMLNTGAEGGEDCLFAKANVLDVNMSNARIALTPYDGGLTIEAELMALDVPVHAWYAAACIDGDSDLSIRADRVVVRGRLAIGAGAGKFDVTIEDADVDLDNFRIAGGGLPGAVANLFTWDSVMAKVAEWGVEKFMDPMINTALAGMVEEKTVAVLGHSLDFQISPSAVEFESSAGKIKLDTRFFIQGSDSAPGFIYTDNGAPTMAANDGFELAMADDMANQLLAGFTAVGGLNQTLALPPGQFTSATIQATLPPMISANTADGSMKLLIGDMRVTLAGDGVDQAQLAINAEVSLKIGGSESGARIALGEPVLHIDVVTDQVANVSGFNPEDLSAAIKMVADHTMDQILPLLGYIPLPMVAGVELTNLELGGRNGYITMSGALR